ncbi:hypothetical protein KR054_007852 [Drosophila jambulina]|nr:hypothetical protein KR054_007852 [Drosophila jambulina]
MTDRGTQTNKRHKVKVSTSSASGDEPENKEENQEESKEEESNREPDPLNPTNGMVFGCQFEVFGIVQGVSFRMYTLRRAQKLGVRGWCQNTTTNTVKGEIEGHYNAFEEMRIWLRYTGSPTSRIDKVVFSETTERPDFTFENFTIVVE